VLTAILMAGKAFSETPVPVVLPGVMCAEQVDQKELSRFTDRERAVKLVGDLASSGRSAYLCKDVLPEGGPVYKVFISEETNQSAVSAGEGGAEALQKAATATGGSPELYERKRQYLHPFLSITESYSDNILNTSTERKSDFVTLISPGLWLSVPLTREKASLITSSTLSPGGFIVENLTEESYRHFQSFLFYQADIELFSHYSSENNVSHRLEGQLKYRLSGGLGIALQDQYLVAYDDRGTGFTQPLSKYQSNLSNLVVEYDTRHKTLVRVGFTNFIVDYDQSENSFRNRMDNVLSASVFYSIRPRIALFGEYEFVDIQYDQNSLLDGKEQHFFGGLRWNVSSKTEGFIKAGYGVKSFSSGISGSHDFILEASVAHRFSSKSSLKVTAWRKTDETDLDSANFILTNGLSASYTHKLTGKLSAFANLAYAAEWYTGGSASAGIAGKPKDHYLTAGLGIQHKFRKWLTNEIGYTYSRRDSSFSSFDYSSNTLYFRLSGAL
jgi:polysaccharide biosynthesis protein VpsM